MKKVDKLVIKIELQTEEGDKIEEYAIHEIKPEVIRSIKDIGIKEEDVEKISGAIEKEMTKLQEKKTKEETEVKCPKCESDEVKHKNRRNKKKTS